MGDQRIDSIKGFGHRNARAMLVCTMCRHFVVVSQPVLDLMFPKIMPTHMAAKKLKCSKCGAKKATIEPVPPPSR